ncbi:MAG: T9SS type A sorting domain-containing protein [Candidatus Kapaibacterium sp.]
MNKTIRFPVAVLLLIFTASVCHAQNNSSAGTDYWLGFMPNGSPGTTNVHEELFIASGVNNTVTITVPGIGQQTVTIAAGQVFDDDVSGSMTAVPEIPINNAIHITSTNPVTVYGYSDWDNGGGIGSSPDGYLGLPTTAYGTSYYTMNFPDNTISFGNMPGEFLIISPSDTNVVTITPAANTMTGRLAGVPWSVTLSKGQSYLVQSPGTNGGSNDLTGSRITSTKPIAVITGHQISSVPSVGPSSADHLLEMIPSVDKWGTQYFDMPMAGRTICGDYIRVLSGENGNQITYNGAGPLKLDSGQYADITNQTVPMVFTSINHKKFIVAQYSYSQGFDGDPGQSDPFMVLFTPQEQFEKEMIFRTPTGAHGAFTNYITFISLNDSLGKITINGAPISSYTSAGTAIFPGTSPLIGSMRILLPASQRNFVATSPSPFGAYQYGFSNFEGYGWPAGMAQRVVSPDTLHPLTQVLAAPEVVPGTCGAYHLRFTDARTIAEGFSFDDTHLAVVALITDSGDSRWPKPSFNYTFTPDSIFTAGDSAASAKITVIDPTKDAYAAIFAGDLAGNDTVFEYHYYSPKFSMSPAPGYDFGYVLKGSDSCMTITLTNTQTAGDFNAQYAIIRHVAAGGNFTVSPVTLSALPPGASTPLTLCYQPTDTDVVSRDTLIVLSQCASYNYPLTGIGTAHPVSSVSLESNGNPILRLDENVPNPFSSSTNISYELPEAGTVTLRVLDLPGRIVRTVLANTWEEAGTHTSSLDLRGLPDGIYFCELSFADAHGAVSRLVERMTLLSE